MTLVDKGEFKEAKQTLEKLPKKYDTSPAVLYWKGVCQYEVNDYAGAINTLSLALFLDKQSPSIVYTRAFAYMEEHHYPLAAADFAAFLVHYPKNEVASHNYPWCLSKMGQTYTAFAYLHSYSYKTADHYVLLASLYREQNDKSNALINLGKALSFDNIEADDLAMAAEIYFVLDEYTSAIQTAEKLLNKEPKNGYAHYLMATYQEEIGMDNLAEEHYDLAIKYRYKPD